MKKTKVNDFQLIYPFTTEMISGYFNRIDFKDKTVLTVGSSLDQAFNAIYLGARKVKVIDINKNTKEFGELKRDIIINSNLENFYKIILSIDMPMSMDVYSNNSLKIMNPYMKDEESFSRLQELLRENENNIEYIEGNIFDLDKYDNEKYDVILTSNVLQYLKDYISMFDDPYIKLKETFNNFKEHLNDNGILQFLYHYSYDEKNNNNNDDEYPTRNIVKVLNALYPDILYLWEFDDFQNTSKDAAFVYKKQR